MITYPIYPRPIPNYRLINNIWGTRPASDSELTISRSRTTRSLSFTEAWRRNRRGHLTALFYHPSDHTLPPRETRTTDPIGQNQSQSAYSRAYHLQNFHDKGYETNTVPTNNDPFGHTHRKRQHFVKGVIPGGSNGNKMIYGTDEMLRQSEEKKKLSQAEKPLGFLYGTEAATQVGKQKPSTRPNNALWLEAREHDDPVGRNRKQASQQDDFLEKHRREKQRQAIELQNEKKKDLEMLRSFEPWGRPGGGAPNNSDVGSNATRRSKAVTALREEEYNPFGRGGGGAPNRTESGKQLTQLRGDPELRFPTYGQSSDVVPNLRYRKDIEYGKDLDNFIDTLRAKKELQRQQSFELELKHNNYDPFGKPGNGAPIKDDRGGVKASYPTTLSGDIEELRSKEPRHPHAYNNLQNTHQENSIWPEERYDPWGKGFGTVERDRTGKIIRAPKPKLDDTDGIGIPVGRPGAGAPITDSRGKVQTRKQQTLTKDNYGQAMSRDFSPKDRRGTIYDPFGKPGAGAPIKDSDGKLKTHLVAQVEHDCMESSHNSSFNNLEAKQTYLKTLQNLKEQADNKRRAENDELRKSGGDVASWIKSGEVGHPKFDPVTKEIIATHRNTSDVTQQKLNIRRQKNEASNAYHNDLQALVNAKQYQRTQERETEKQDSMKHVDTMNHKWGRPGAGAPLYGGEMRKQRVGLTPADEMTFRLG